MRPAISFMRQPTAGEPVKLSSLKRSSIDQPLAQLPRHGQDRDGALGQAGSAMISATVSIVSGEAEGGLSTTEQPAAMAGATLCAARLSGKLKGLMAATGPDGEAPRDAEPAGVGRPDVQRDGLADEALGLLGREAEGQGAAVDLARGRPGWACPIRA